MGLLRHYTSLVQTAKPNIKFFFAGLLLASASRGAYMVLFNLYLRDLGYTESFVGQTVSLQALAAALILIPAGILSDRLGRKKMMFLANIAKGLGMCIAAMTQNSLLLLMTVFVIGMSHACFMITNAPFLSENTEPRERLHLFSISWSIMMFSTMLGNVAGGYMADSLETVALLGPILSKRITLIVFASLSILSLWPLYRIREESSGAPPTFRTFLANIKGSGEMGIIMKFVLAQFLVGLGAGLFVPYFNLYFASEFSLSTGRIGTIMALGQAMMALAALIGPPLAQSLGRVKAICSLQFASILFLLFLGQTSILLIAVVSFLLRGALMNSANPMTVNLMMDHVSDSMKGTANSLKQLVFQLGWAICGPISGYLIQIQSYQFVFNVAAVFYIFSTTLFYFLFRSLERSKEQDGREMKGYV